MRDVSKLNTATVSENHNKSYGFKLADDKYPSNINVHLPFYPPQNIIFWSDIII